MNVTGIKPERKRRITTAKPELDLEKGCRTSGLSFTYGHKLSYYAVCIATPNQSHARNLDYWSREKSPPAECARDERLTKLQNMEPL